MTAVRAPRQPIIVPSVLTRKCCHRAFALPGANGSQGNVVLWDGSRSGALHQHLCPERNLETETEDMKSFPQPPKDVLLRLAGADRR